MSKVKISEEEAALRRFNIFKNRKRQLVYIRKWRKKAYVVNRDHFRFIQIYSYRFFAVILVVLFVSVWLDSWLYALGLAAFLWLIAEGLYEFFFVRHLNSTKMPEKDEQIGFLEGALAEDPKIVNIKMVSFFFIGVVSLAGALMGSYQGVYLVGMLGIAAYGFYQCVFFFYVNQQRKKGK